MSRHKDEDNQGESLTVYELLARMGKDTIESKSKDTIATNEVSNQNNQEENSTPRGEITEEFYRITDDIISSSDEDTSEEFENETPAAVVEEIETNNPSLVVKSNQKEKTPNYLKLSIEIIVALLVGAGVFYSFGELWQLNQIVASVASFIITIFLMISVVVIQEKPRISTVILSIFVSMLLTLLPLVLILQNT